MNRRHFISSAVAATAVGATGQLSAKPSSSSEPFKLMYAPGFRHFKNSAGEDPLDQIQFIYDNGFRGIEDNGMMKKDPVLQTKIGAKLAKLGMTMGVFVTGFGMYSLTVSPSECLGLRSRNRNVNLRTWRCALNFLSLGTNKDNKT